VVRVVEELAVMLAVVWTVLLEQQIKVTQVVKVTALQLTTKVAVAVVLEALE
jgi:hypothetical protein